MEAQLLMLDNVHMVQMDDGTKALQLGRVLNTLTVETLPFVSKLSFFVKLQNIQSDEMINIGINVYDEEDLVAYTGKMHVYNQRQKDQVPGVDTWADLSITMTRAGYYKAILFIEDKATAMYSYNVRVKDI
ncbi:hypothetical protein [Brevibacillus brevis]|uniref:Uncharacterized protein n=1 Tax=Brevibacillus brevis TaxID=1393 RepID=A0A517I5M8_BREBE|nr:hypothetical protein [Brevibacillus brevis]QDS34162.1 hypothetical protein FPS98_09330 [Brevibacillus brevis]